MRRFFLGGVALACLLMASTAWAQSSSLFGSSSSGSSSSGSSSSSSNSNSALSSMAGSSGLSISGADTEATSSQDSFVGRGDSGFVGNQSASSGTSSRSSGQSSSRSSLSSRQSTTRQNSFSQNRTQSRRNTQSSTQASLRIRQKVAFAYPQPSVSATSASVRARFEKLAATRPEFGDVDFDVDAKGEVTLRDAVPSEEAGAVIVSMLRLEPAVRSVRSELTIPGAPMRSPRDLLGP